MQILSTTLLRLKIVVYYSTQQKVQLTMKDLVSVVEWWRPSANTTKAQILSLFFLFPFQLYMVPKEQQLRQVRSIMFNANRSFSTAMQGNYLALSAHL